MATTKERDEFITRMVAEFGDQSLNTARLLLRHAKTHGRLAEMACNGSPAQSNPNLPIEQVNKCQARWDAWIEKREAQIERRIKQLCDEIGLPVDFGGDPRGYTVKVFFPSGKYNTWGGAESGYGIPQ